MFRFRFLAIVFVLAGPLAPTVCRAEPVTLQLKWRHAFQFAGYYAAQAKGFYREAGFDVHIKEATPGQNVVAEVVSGRAEYGVGTSSLLLERHAGQPVVALAVVFQHSPYVLITGKQAGIVNIHDLVDKRLMMEPLSDELLAYLRREGIPLERVTRLEHSFDIRDLIERKTDAISAYVTNQPFYLRLAGFDYQLFSPRSAGVDFYGDNLFTSERVLRERPDRVKAFREASLRGWEYAMAHPEEIAALILAQYNTQRHSLDYLRFEADQMRELLQPELVPAGYMNPGRWRHIADTYAEIGMLPKGVQLEGFLYDADPKTDYSWLYRLLAGGALLILLVGGVSLHISRINRRLKASLAEVHTAHDQLQVLSTAVEQSPTGIMITGPDTRIQYVNPHFCAISGFRAEEALGQTPDLVSSGQNDPAVFQNMWQRLNQGEAWTGELLNRRKSGTCYWEEVHIAPVKDDSGATSHYVAVKLDIDARKQAEAEARRFIEQLTQANDELKALNERLEQTKGQLQQSEKMAAIGQLAAGVAHEINNPIGFVTANLGSLKGYVGVLLRVIEAYKGADAVLAGHAALRESIEQAKSSADLDFVLDDIGCLIKESLDGVHRVRKIVDNLKDFTRLDMAEWQIANLENGLESTLSILGSDFGSKAEIRRVYAGIPEIECIASQLNQVFMNLLLNAVQAIGERGVITLRTGFDDDSVWVAVEDDGVGIAPEHLSRVFEPFFTTRPVGKGTGLGLSLAYGIVQQHHGQLTVCSEPGKGAIFRLTLPRRRRQLPLS